MTNASRWSRIGASMRKERRTGSPLIAEDDFERRFERAFGREMTAEERRFLRLANLLLDHNIGIEEELLEEAEDTKSKGTAA